MSSRIVDRIDIESDTVTGAVVAVKDEREDVEMVDESEHDVVPYMKAEEYIEGPGSGHEKSTQNEVIFDLCELLRTVAEKNRN